MPSNKDIDPDGIDKAAKACEEKGCVIVYGGLVKKINETKGESKRILIVSDTFITFVKKPMFPALSHTRSWSDLVSIRNIDKDGLELIFKKNNKNLQFRFKSRELTVIRKKIVDLLYHTLTEVELSKIDMEFQHPEITINPRGILSRFDEHLVKRGMALTESKLRSSFKLYCQTLRPNCIPKSIETPQEMKALFYALMAAPFTKALFFPGIKNEEVIEKMYKYLGLFVNSPGGIHFFSFKNAITPRFDAFIDFLLQKSETPINGIGFREVDMPDESAEKIKRLIGEKNLLSLRWCTISPLTSTDTLLSDKNVRRSLRYLALDRTKGLNLRKIAPRLSHIVVLSLENCGLEIADAFKIINKNNLNELKLLNLAYNNATKPFESSTVISSKLERIDISHIKFNNNVMANILEVILTADYDNGLKFYCDKYHDEDQESDDALDIFQKINCENLLEFSWRKNKIDQNLLNFLKRSTSLQKLIFEGNICNTEEENVVENFAAILKSLENLTHLYVCGYKKAELGKDFEDHLLSSLKKLPKLSFLDVSNNSISDQGINAITSSLKELPNLTHLILDNNAITSNEPLKKLVEKAEQLHKKLFISWPVNDIKSLQREEKISDAMIFDLKARFKSASEGSIFIPNRSTITLDDGAVIDAKNSSSVKNKKSLAGNQKKQRAGSFFIRAGSVRNIKRALAEGDERSQDPDSIFIQPFDCWFGDISDNDFPLYLTEELINDFDVQKYDPEADENDETEFESDSYYEEKSDKEEVKSNAIQSRNIKTTNNSDSEHDNKKTVTKNNDNRRTARKDTNQRRSNQSDDDDIVETRNTRQRNSNQSDDDEDRQVKTRNTRQRNSNQSDDDEEDRQVKTRNTRQRNSNQSDDDEEDRQIKTRNTRQFNSNQSDDEDDKYNRNKGAKQNAFNISDSEDEYNSKQQTQKYVKAPPSLRPVDEVLKRQNQQSPSSTKRNSYRNNDSDEERESKPQKRFDSLSDKIIDDNDEVGEVKERNIAINQNSDEKPSDDSQSRKSAVSQRYKKKKFPTPNYSQTQSQKLVSRSVAKTSAPVLDLDENELADVAFGDQVNEAEPFEPPSWSFPVPRVLRVSNSSFLSELNDKYSVASVINSLRSKK